MSDEPTTDAEILSAYLDGDATADEAARIEADPLLSSQAAALDAVRRRLAVDAPPAGLVDDHVRAALAAFDDAPSGTPPVADLSARRRRLRERIPLGAVAAAVMVLALFGALTQLDSGDDDTAATDVASDAMLEGDDSTAGEAAPDNAGDEGAARDAAEDGDAETETFGAGAAGEVPEFADIDELAEHLAATQARTTSQGDMSSDPDPGAGFESEELSAASCDAVDVAGADPATVTVTLRALLAGVPVTAVVTDGSPDVPVQRLVVVDERTCSVIDDRQL